MSDMEWMLASPAGAPPPGEMLAVELASTAIVLYNLDGRYFATQAICTHGSGFLADGEIEAGEIVCPLHLGRFDIATGAATGAPCRDPLTVYETKLENGAIYVALPRSAEKKEG